MTGRARVLNCAFDRLTLPQTVDRLFDDVPLNRRGWVSTVNVSTLMAMRRDPYLQSFVERGKLVVADGQPLVWCAPLFDGRLPERVTGIDLVLAICERASAADTCVYVLGSTPELNRRALRRLRSRYPGLRVEGSDGYFTDAEAPARAAAVRQTGSAILLVGMGTPRQEAFIDSHWESFGVCTAIGVGGSIDVLAGARLRAHPRLRQAGLEWMVRLFQEPRRLFLRYLRANSRFIVLIVRSVGARITVRA